MITKIGRAMVKGENQSDHYARSPEMGDYIAGAAIGLGSEISGMPIMAKILDGKFKKLRNDMSDEESARFVEYMTKCKKARDLSVEERRGLNRNDPDIVTKLIKDKILKFNKTECEALQEGVTLFV